MKQDELIYEIADFRIGIDADMPYIPKVTSGKPDATCFIVPSEDMYLQKLFSSYALFSPDSCDHIRKGLSLIVHIESDAALLHGGLTLMDDKAVLILGQSGSGKSTLTNALGQLIDDDTLVFRNDMIYVPSVNGYKAFGRSPGKRLSIAYENPEPVRPDICLLLDKSLKGATVLPTEEIPLEYYMPDYFSKANTEMYRQYNTFKKPEWLKAYIVGTDGDLEGTVAAIKALPGKSLVSF